MTLKQSVCLPMVNTTHLPLSNLVKACAEIGYPAVEIWGRDETFEELAGLCRQYGVVICSMIGHDGIASGFNDPAAHERIEAELHASIDFAAAQGVAGLICFSGNRRPGQSDEDAVEACAVGLRRIAPYAEKKGVNLNMELLNSKIDHVGYQCDHTAWGAAVCRKVNSPRVKLLYDIYHMQIMEGDIIRTIRENIQWIGHFHTAGVPGREDMDDTQELNYTAISQAINAAGYDQYMGHEFRPRGDVVKALRQAYLLCER